MKTTKWFLLIMIFISLCATFCIVAANCFSPISCDEKKITDNATAYKVLAQLYIEDYKKHASGTSYAYSTGYEGDGECVISCYTGDYIFSIEDEMLAYSKSIENSYYVDEQLWEYVRVNNNFVVFGNVNGRASVIYSANDKKPSFVGDPNEIDKNIYVKRIADNLFFSAKR